MTEPMPEPTDHLVEHLANCRKVDAVLVGDAGVDMTPAVEKLLAGGWTWGGQEIVAGKRVRYLTRGDGGLT